MPKQKPHKGLLKRVRITKSGKIKMHRAFGRHLLATNYRKADITTKQKVMLDFAVKVSLHANEISDSDIEEMYQHGFSVEDIWDIGAITAFFSLSNRMANLTSMRPNDEFYLLGRIAKD